MPRDAMGDDEPTTAQKPRPELLTPARKSAPVNTRTARSVERRQRGDRHARRGGRALVPPGPASRGDSSDCGDQRSRASAHRASRSCAGRRADPRRSAAGTDRYADRPDADGPAADRADPRAEARRSRGGSGRGTHARARRHARDINSIPWSRVAIDARTAGTSGKRFAVTAGQHAIVLTTQSGNEVRTTLDVGSGSTRIYCWDFGKGTECLR
jgi:hypothetical protein